MESYSKNTHKTTKADKKKTKALNELLKSRAEVLGKKGGKSKVTSKVIYDLDLDFYESEDYEEYEEPRESKSKVKKIPEKVPEKKEQAFQFERENLNSNVQYIADNFSAETVNSWGIVTWKETNCSNNCNNNCRCEKVEQENFWVANNGSNTLVKYSEDGKLLYKVNVSGPPTGLVTNHSSNFGGFELITVTERGTIEGFDWAVSPNQTIVIINNPTAVYKGIAIKKDRLYVTNFATSQVEIYDSTNTALVKTFTDDALVESGYAPFNVAVNKKYVYVTFARKDGNEEVAGEGFGYVDIFSRDGELLFRLINREPLNAPWGMLFSGEYLYVANFGDGRINVFDLCSGECIKTLTDKCDNILTLDSLWGIVSTKCRGIAFASGIDNEVNGLIGILKPV